MITFPNGVYILIYYKTANIFLCSLDDGNIINADIPKERFFGWVTTNTDNKLILRFEEIFKMEGS